MGRRGKLDRMRLTEIDLTRRVVAGMVPDSTKIDRLSLVWFGCTVLLFPREVFIHDVPQYIFPLVVVCCSLFLERSWYGGCCH